MLTRYAAQFDLAQDRRAARADPTLNYFLHAVAELEQRLARLSEAQHALRASEARYRALYESNPAICFTLDEDGVVLSVNAQGAHRLGYRAEELIGRNVLALAADADREAMRQALYACVREVGRVYCAEARKCGPASRALWARETMRAVQEPGGTSVVLLVWEDIGELKHASEQAQLHARDLERLHELTQALALNSSAATLLPQVLEGALRLLEATSGALWLQDDADGALQLAQARNTLVARSVRADTDAGIVGQVACERRALVCEGTSLPGQHAPTHAIGAPLVSGDRLVGVMAVWCTDAVHPYREEAARLLALYAAPSASAIARLQTQEALRHADERFRSFAELSSDWYWEQDRHARYTRLSGGLLERTGFDPRQDIGLAGWELNGVESGEALWSAHRALLDARRPFRDFVYKRRNLAGELRYHSLSGQPVYDADGRFIGYRGIGRDVTERFTAEQRIHRLAHYDSLCGLPNRVLFHQYLEQALQRARRSGTSLAVLSLDLDRFKNINDSFGHAAGDQVLREVAERLSQVARAPHAVARLSGDEFVVLSEGGDGPSGVSAFARALLQAVAQPYLVAGQECHLSASMGISMYPQDSLDGPALLRDADTAMNRAKEKGKNSFQFYSAHMNAQAYERLALESRLRRAVERDELVLHYQPTVDLRTGRTLSVEALLRWPQADGRIIGPSAFIPVAEDCGLIEALGEWVLCEACMQAQAWRAAGLPPIRIAVNLSARQFMQEDLLTLVARVIAETRIEPALLEFEITESLMFGNPEHAAGLLHALKLMGVRLSLDDFGTGYSSLSYLKRFPFDCVKIDRSFIRDLPEDKDDAAITRAVIAMAHNLRMTVTAEGVENEAQLAFLRECGCDAAQGNHFSPPLIADGFEALYVRGMRTLPGEVARLERHSER